MRTGVVVLPEYNQNDDWAAVSELVKRSDQAAYAALYAFDQAAYGALMG